MQFVYIKNGATCSVLQALQRHSRLHYRSDKRTYTIQKMKTRCSSDYELHRVMFYLPVFSPPHEEQEPLQDFACGQPMHFTPLLLACITYAAALPRIRTSTAMRIILTNKITPYSESAYSTFTCASALCIRYVIIPAKTAIATSPGIKPTPTLPVAISVPI